MGKLSFRLGIGGTSDMLGKFSRTRLSQGSMSSSKLEASEFLVNPVLPDCCCCCCCCDGKKMVQTNRR